MTAAMAVPAPEAGVRPRPYAAWRGCLLDDRFRTPLRIVEGRVNQMQLNFTTGRLRS